MFLLQFQKIITQKKIEVLNDNLFVFTYNSVFQNHIYC